MDFKLKVLFLLSIIILSCFQEEEHNNKITICIETFPTSLDPRYASDQSSERVLTLTHRGLFKFKENMDIEPDIIESYQFINPQKIFFKLKKNIFFSDGKRLTSDDVIFTINSILYEKPISPRASELKEIKNIVKIDDNSFTIELKKTFVPILSLLNFGIIKSGTKFQADIPPEGCGYFKIKKFVGKNEIVLEENPYSEIKPKVKNITIKIIENPFLRILELLRGSVDLVVNDIPYDSLKNLKKKGFKVIRVNGTNYAYIGLNCKKYPLDQREVRIALAMAVNRKTILENILNGYGREATGLLSPENWAYSRTSNPEFNPTKAEKILEEKKFFKDKNGTRVKFSYKCSTNRLNKLIAEAIYSDFKKIGIELKIETLEWGTFYNDIKEGNFELFSLNWIGIKDPDAFRLRFHSLFTPPFGLNRTFYTNKELDSILEEASKEPDKKRRFDLYKRVQEILSEDQPYINLWWPDIVVVSNKRIKNINIAPDGNFIFLKDVEIKKD